MKIKTELSFGAHNVKNRWPKFLFTQRALLLPLALVIALLGGCAIGNTYEYRLPRMPLPVEGSSSIGLAVTDQRPYILSGDKEPDFVGLQ
ncbi:MAG: hypothetical protein VBE63_29025, partial [Lamprobacter sp.]|uniref:hypothetical protein n=1 Tax=Lamprobacter sp. TaxID=3100796 RepID=UPI002B25A5C3